MKKSLFAGLIVLTVVMSGTVAVAAGPANFDQAVCDHFKVSQDVLEEVRWVGIPDDEVPVVFLVSKHSKLDAVTVASMRARGDNWAALTRTRNVSPEVFYTPVSGYVHSDIYGPIYHKFQSLPKKNWFQIRLTDAEIIDLVNLQFVTKEYDYSMHEVMAQRDAGMSFAQLQATPPAGEDASVASRAEAREAKANKVAGAGM